MIVLFVVQLASLWGQQGTRTIPYAPNRTIAERLLPSDKLVQVHRPYDYPVFYPEPSARDILQGLLQEDYGTAAVVDVSIARGILVDEDRWIRTLFEGTVIEILNNPPGNTGEPLATGAKISFSLDGGQLKIGDVLVKTTESLSFPVNRRYLVFLGPRYTDADHLMLGTDPVLIEGDKLVALPQSDTKLAGLTIADVRAMARRMKE
jgi:hypothetical protein